MPDRTFTAIDPACVDAQAPLPHWPAFVRNAAAGVAEDGSLLFVPGEAIVELTDWLAPCLRGEVAVAVVTENAAAEPSTVPLRPDFPDYTGWDGSALWGRLHRETNPTPETVEAIIAAVCPRCQPRARALLGEIPPVFTTLGAYHYWSWAYHNAVSASIGSATLTYEEAAARWGW